MNFPRRNSNPVAEKENSSASQTKKRRRPVEPESPGTPTRRKPLGDTSPPRMLKRRRENAQREEKTRNDKSRFGSCTMASQIMGSDRRTKVVAPLLFCYVLVAIEIRIAPYQSKAFIETCV